MRLVFSAILLFVSGSLFAQNPNYDSTLAKKLGGDDYGMKKYYLVILKTGDNQNKNKAFRDSCFKSHFTNMRVMEEKGKLIIAGPITTNKQGYRGIFIMESASQAEVVQHLAGDASIKERIFDPEILEWYGSAALPMYIEHTDKIWKKRF